jgi:hypothetical protein
LASEVGRRAAGAGGAAGDGVTAGAAGVAGRWPGTAVCVAAAVVPPAAAEVSGADEAIGEPVGSAALDAALDAVLVAAVLVAAVLAGVGVAAVLAGAAVALEACRAIPVVPAALFVAVARFPAGFEVPIARPADGADDGDFFGG